MEELRELVARAKLGEADAFGEIYKFYYKDMYRYAYYMLKNPDDASDAVEEATLDSYRGIGNLREADKLKSWLFTILHAKCKRCLMKYANLSEDYVESEELEAVADENSSDVALSLDVRSALDKLPPDDRQIVVMHTMQGFTTREIADVIGMNENTVRTRHKRALDKLRVLLE